MLTASPLRRLLACFALTCLLAAPALAADATDEARLEALRQALNPTQPPPAAASAVAQVCWTPHTDFSAVGATDQIPFGPRTLIARYMHPKVSADTPLLAVWTHDGEPLSTGNCLMTPTADFVTNGVNRTDGPLLPGLYRVRFLRGDTEVAAGQINILPPAPLGARDAKALFTEALGLTHEGLRAINAGQAQPAAQVGARALPLLATVVSALPTNQDAAATLEICNALVAIGKMETEANLKNHWPTLDWATRALAHARNAGSIATDKGLQQVAGIIVQTMEPAIPKLRQAAEKK